MRVNVYAEEMTERVEIVRKTINGQEFVGLRLYLFWGKRDLRVVLHKMLAELDKHYEQRQRDGYGYVRHGDVNEALNKANKT